LYDGRQRFRSAVHPARNAREGDELSDPGRPGHDRHRHTAERAEIVLAFSAIYVIWGSTYLAIRFAIETMPPLMMAATRFLIAGSLLYAWVRLRGTPAPRREEWRSTAVVGGLMLLGGNGAVVWAEQRVPSGVTALLVALVPLWMVLLEWWLHGGSRPDGRTVAGLLLGLAGLALLVGPEEILGGGHVDHVGTLVLALGTLSWAVGSLYSRRAHLPASPMLATAMEMLGGGVLLLGAAGLRGEWSLVDPSAVSLRSALSIGYLVVFGSLVAFTTYIWLLRVTTPARVSTYAYVNPVVAMVLGWWLAGESLAPRTLLAAAVIVAGVVLITIARGGRPRRA
jgi:drug/metabolite transporter (DMT)-like permease